MRRLRVGVLFGGRSGEHEVSVQSAASIVQALDPAKYEVIPIGITKAGRWLVGAAPQQFLAAGEVRSDLALPVQPTALLPDPTQPGLVPLDAGALAATGMPTLDVVFPVLHGPYGEDGTVQGLLDLAGIPYVGSGVAASAVGMDKALMKAVFRDAGLPVVDHLVVLRRELEADLAGVCRRIEARLGYPCFVKPANLGSSVGISKVHGSDELPSALAAAAAYDRKLVVEAAAEDCREIECSVLGNDEPVASVPGEIIPGREFYDYEAKYLDAGSQLIIPARLSETTTQVVRDLAVRAFRAIDGAGLARVDFFVHRQTEQVWVNEINTMPGFTRISMYPKLWEASGLPYPQLVDRLIELALERHADRRRNRIER